MTSKPEEIVETDWYFACAGVRGPGHVKLKLPNQDACNFMTSSDGRVVSAVVSDGAGSAARSEEGSQLCVGEMSARLLGLGVGSRNLIAEALKNDVSARENLRSHLIKGLEKVRSLLEARIASPQESLRDFAHTFTGLVITPVGGLLVQVGDSPALLARAEESLGPDGHPGVDYLAEYRVFTEEKGEYANETNFVTQANWAEKLRIAVIAPDRMDAYLLMSDGAFSLLMNRGHVFKPFIGPLLSKLLQAGGRGQRDQLLLSALSSPECDAVTADDKTLLVIYPRKWGHYRSLEVIAPPPVHDDEALPKPAPPPALPLPQPVRPIPQPVPLPVPPEPKPNQGNADKPAPDELQAVLKLLLAFVLGILATYLAIDLQPNLEQPAKVMPGEVKPLQTKPPPASKQVSQAPKDGVAAEAEDERLKVEASLEEMAPPVTPPPVSKVPKLRKNAHPTPAVMEEKKAETTVAGNRPLAQADEPSLPRAPVDAPKDEAGNPVGVAVVPAPVTAQAKAATVSGQQTGPGSSH